MNSDELIFGINKAADDIARYTGEDEERCHMALRTLLNPLGAPSASEVAAILIAWYQAGRHAEREARKRAGIE